MLGEDDRLEPGYVYRPDDRPIGRFDLAFVRADVTQDMELHTSDTEAVIDAAADRVSGEVFFQQEITGAGLGRMVPGVHFDVGDIVDVRIWGRELPLPVTSTAAVVGDDGRASWAVHVGGQLISDAEKLRELNSKTQAAIDADRRKNRKAIGAATKTAGEAKSTADEALGRVEDAEGEFQQSLSAIDAAVQASAGHVAQGEQHVRAGEALVTSALGYASAAEFHAGRALELVDQADGILASTEGYRDQAGAIRDQVQALNGEIATRTAAMGQLVASGAGHAA
ncbi:MAG: hypothetical protein Q4F65_12120, partial [Propionibacteriaceae bacterium]|nr:hypothetical protein [Propionibacteriaceae bacterium]